MCYSLGTAVDHEAAGRERAPRGAPPLAQGPPLASRAALDGGGRHPLFPAPLARRAAVDARAAIIKLTTLTADAAVG